MDKNICAPINSIVTPQEGLQQIKFNTVDLFADRHIYMDCLRMYYGYYNEIPSIKVMNRVDNKKALSWLEQEYKDSILCKHYKEKYDPRRKKSNYPDIIFLLQGGLMVNLVSDCVYVVFSHGLEKDAKELFDLLKKFIIMAKRTAEISLVVRGLNGLQATAMKLKKPRLVLEKSYNDDLLPIHNKVLKSLRKENKSGLILLHGAPGTGKSTYIRYLIHHLNKSVIFIPPSLALEMDSPGFMEFLIEHKNSVFVIEDAEQLLIARGGNRSSSISMLLNLTDGLLGECLGIQVIATFNTHLSHIDKALMRKGRLTALYEFQPLNAEKAKSLLKDLGIGQHIVTKEMTLAEIYNVQEESFELNREIRPIGFKVHVA